MPGWRGPFIKGEREGDARMKNSFSYAARRQALIEQFGTVEAADLYLAEEAKQDASDAVQALKAERSRGRAP